jgi:hypothetical protein
MTPILGYCIQKLLKRMRRFNDMKKLFERIEEMPFGWRNSRLA